MMKIKDSRLSFLLKDTVLYGGTTAVGRMLNVITLPLIARALDTADFGALDALRIFGNITLMFCLFGLDQSAVILARDEEKETVRANYLGKGLRTAFINSILSASILFLFAEQFLGFYLDVSYQSCFRLLIYSIPFMTLFQFSQTILKWNFKRAHFLIITVGNIVFVLLSVLVLALLDSLTIQTVLTTYLISFSLFSILGLFFCRGLIAFNLKKKLLPSMILFGWPFLFDSLVASLVPSIDRYFISNNLSIEEIGLYAVAFRVSSIMKLPLIGLQMAFGPFALKYRDDQSAKGLFTNVMVFVTTAATILAVFISINGSMVITLTASSKYIGAVELLTPLVFAIVFESMCEISGYGIVLSKKTYLNSVSYSTQLVSAVIFIMLLINDFGLLGVAYGIMLSKLIYFGVKTTFAQLNYKANPNTLISIIIVIIGFTTSLTLSNLDVVPWKANILVIGIFAFIILIMQRLKFFDFNIFRK